MQHSQNHAGLRLPNRLVSLLLSLLLTVMLAAIGAQTSKGAAMAGTFAGYEAVSEKDFDPVAEVTIEAWVRGASSGATTGCIVDKTVQGDGYVLEILPQGTLRLITSKAETCDAAVVLPPDRVTYLAGVYDSARKVMKLYVDGKPAAGVVKGNFPPLFHSVMPLRIGADQLGDHAFTGTIERVAISDHARSAGQIVQRNLHPKTPVDGELGEWSFQGQTGSVVRPVVGTVGLQRAPAPSTFTGSATPPDSKMSLWYRRPAVEWTEASPIGNGRLGAMVFGRVERERIQLNEDTFWSGQPHDYANPDALAALPMARQLIAAGKYAEADRLISAKLQGNPKGQCQYEPVGDLSIDLPGGSAVSDYRRDLNIDTAIASVSYIRGGVRFTREVLSSPVDQVMVVRLTADRPGQITFTARLRTPQNATPSTEGNNTLVMQGIGPTGRNGLAGKLPFACVARVVPEGGSLTAADGAVTLAGADAATVFLDAGTGYKNFEDITADPLAGPRRHVSAAAAKPFDMIRSDHINEHQRLFRRVTFDLGTTAASQQPADERRVNFAAGADDPQLATLYYQFGRYLLISSSRPGSQPANLQGIWNSQTLPPWGSNWTANINIEMNYWPAETCNLSECAAPLFAFIRELSVNGTRTASEAYGLPGWCAHHNIDLWRSSNPAGEGVGAPTWANWCVAGPWLCAHLYEHYRFTGDAAFLRERAYPLMRSAAEFCLAWLIEDGKGHLTTCPSESTENDFLAPDGKPAMTSAGCTMDMALIRELFGNCVDAAKTLGIDEDFSNRLDAAAKRLVPFQIGSHGQLQEWSIDFAESTPGQRHMSHLYPLFPGSQITPRGTPELAKAARISLERRLAAGGAYTGWSRAWAINFWARLCDGDKAWESLIMLMQHSTNRNLFDTHPAKPSQIFQIDGNFGATAAVAEMLLQSHTGSLDLLPALPAAWTSGKVDGLRARGAVTVGMTWSGGRLTSCTLHPDHDQTVRLRPPNHQTVRSVASGATSASHRGLGNGVAEIALRSGRTYTVAFA